MPTNLRTNVLLSSLLALAPGLVDAMPSGTAPGDGAPGAGATAELKADAPRIQLSVPLFSEQFADAPAAQVGAEVVTIRDLAEALAMTHSEHEGAAKKKDFRSLLDRLIDLRLIVLEARSMGLDEVADVKTVLGSYHATTPRETLKARAVANVRPDPEDVDRIYRPAVQEWRVRSVLFAEEADAVAFAAGAKDATAFAAAASGAIKGGKARGDDEGQYIGRKKALPQVIAAVEKLKVGEVSAPVKVPEGYAILLVEDTRFPDVPEVRAEVERMVMTPMLQQALRGYFKDLTKKHAAVNRKVLAALNYEAKKPGFSALAKDKRVLVQIHGEAPVTVADLSAELKKQFFHGMEQAAKEGKVNRKKEQYFESLLFRRLLDKEAKVQRVADEPQLRKAAAEYERSILFTAFVERVVAPDVKVEEAEARAYYDAHQADFTYPDFYKLETIGFARAADAQAACEKLKAGTDTKWLRANAEGQLDPKKRSLEMEGTVTAESMPAGLAPIISGASAGECRIFAVSDAECYAVLVADKVPSRVRPFEEARPAIEKKVFDQDVARSVEDWTKKLRQAQEVNVFVTGIGG